MIRILEFIPFLGTCILVCACGLLPSDPSLLRLVVLAVFAADSAALFSLDRKKLASPIHWGMLGFAALAAAALWLRPEDAGRVLSAHPATAVYAVLLAVALLPPLFGKEVFITFFARKKAPEEFWGTDAFLEINRRLTGLWAILFLLCGLASLAPHIFNLHGLFYQISLWGFLPVALMAGVGIPITVRYPGYYMRTIGTSQTESAMSEGPKPVSAPSPPASPVSSFEAGPEAAKTEAGDTARGGVVVALNGSPHSGSGNTFMMLEMLRTPLLDRGFRLEIVNLAEHDIRYCMGCGFCLEKGACWIDDDHREIAGRLMDASGIILASPVYFNHVTAQMKTFIDRSLAYGHKPRATWKPGLAVSVSAGLGETETAAYLSSWLRPFGAFSVGALTAMAVSPGEFTGKETVEARAIDLARDLTAAIVEKRRYPATDKDLRYYQFMSHLVRSKKDSVMRHDHEHWQKHGFYAGFEAYVQQTETRVENDEAMRQASIKDMIAEQKNRKKGRTPLEAGGPGDSAAPIAGMSEAIRAAGTCEELLALMPLNFNSAASGGLEAVYQFEVSGAESFAAHLRITAGTCSHHAGAAAHPDIVIKTPADVWLAVSRGEIDGQYAFMTGKFAVEGDLGLLLRLKTLFPR